MEEARFGKYLRLFGSIFFLILGTIVAIILLLLGIRLLFGLMSYIPWFTYVYMLFILLVPSVLFTACYLVYFKRTAAHPNKAVRIVSYVLFSAALIAWGIFLVQDIIIFSKHAYAAIGMYHSYDMVFLSLNVACFFIVGVIQAFTTSKEVDWMERNKNNLS